MELIYSTDRIDVFEVSNDISFACKTGLLNDVIRIFTPPVVEHLPPYFHHVNDIQSAQVWLDHITAEGKVFVLIEKTKAITIGFIFVSCNDTGEANIGYLLSETIWGMGFAKESLTGFIKYASTQLLWRILIAGVDEHNLVSSHLLNKLGFKEHSRHKDVVFFAYAL